MLGTVGETLHKAALRLSGCIVDAVFGIGTIVLLMPLMTDLGQLLLLVAAVTFLAAWIGFGSERIAHAGWQLGLAFYLSTFWSSARSPMPRRPRPRWRRRGRMWRGAHAQSLINAAALAFATVALNAQTVPKWLNRAVRRDLVDGHVGLRSRAGRPDMEREVLAQLARNRFVRRAHNCVRL